MTSVRRWWAELTFGTNHAGARLATLAGLGALTGFGESATVLLVVALASGHRGTHRALVFTFPSSTWVLAGVTIGVLAALAGVHLASARVTARAGAASLKELRRRLVDAYLDTSWSAQSAEHAGQLQELVMGNAAQVAFGTQQAATAVASALNLVVVVAAATAVNPWSLIGLAVIATLTVAVVRPSRAHAGRLARRAAAATSALALGVSETALLSRELRAFDASSAAGEHLGERIDTSAEHFEAARFASAAVPNLSRDLTIAVLVAGLAVIANSNDATLTEIGASVVLLLRGLSQAQVIATVAHQLTERSANLERIRGYLRRWAAAVPPAGTRACPRRSAVELEDVWYRYGSPGGEAAVGRLLGGAARDVVDNEEGKSAPYALAGVSLRIEAGEQIGVVGRTGAGKSTLAGVLLGVLGPERGAVCVGGVPLAEMAPGEWQKRVAWVPQDPRLLTGSVADNIRFFRTHLDDAAVTSAAVGAGIGAELAEWPDGIHRRVGPGGVALSGGQRQRITLARALAGAPDVVVLDEPTSALDTVTEAAIQASLGALRGRVTVVIIAHRSALLASCDRVVGLEAGRLVSRLAGNR